LQRFAHRKVPLRVTLIRQSPTTTHHPTAPPYARGCCSLDDGALLLKRYARPSIETVVDLPHQALSNGTCAASGRL
jgi:hypothetical protein